MNICPRIKPSKYRRCVSVIRLETGPNSLFRVVLSLHNFAFTAVATAPDRRRVVGHMVGGTTRQARPPTTKSIYQKFVVDL
jgi:hypothetical protein